MIHFFSNMKTTRSFPSDQPPKPKSNKLKTKNQGTVRKQFSSFYPFKVQTFSISFSSILFDVLFSANNSVTKCKFTSLRLQNTIHIVLHHVMCCVIEFVPLFVTFFLLFVSNPIIPLMVAFHWRTKWRKEKTSNFPQTKLFHWTCNGSKPISYTESFWCVCEFVGICPSIRHRHKLVWLPMLLLYLVTFVQKRIDERCRMSRTRVYSPPPQSHTKIIYNEIVLVACTSIQHKTLAPTPTFTNDISILNASSACGGCLFTNPIERPWFTVSFFLFQSPHNMVADFVDITQKEMWAVKKLQHRI